MGRGSGIVAGMAVLAAGIIALASQLGDPGPSTAEEPAPVVMAPVGIAIPATVDTTVPTLAGVPPAVQQVLYARGHAEVVQPEEVEEVPAAVSRLLSAYSVPLRVPNPPGGDGS